MGSFLVSEIKILAFHAFDKLGENLWIFYRQFGEDFPIKQNILFLEEENETAIGGPIFSEGIVEIDDPERTERALLGSAITTSILPSLDNSFFSLGEKFLPPPTIPLGFLKNIFVALFGHDATLDSGHIVFIKQLTGYRVNGLGIQCVNSLLCE